MNRIEVFTRSFSRFLMVVVFGGMAACASARPPRPTTAAASAIGAEGSSMRTEATSHCYTEADIARIEMMREEGSGLAEVVKVVGGTDADLREVEQRLRVSRRDSHRAAPRIGAACSQVTVAP